LSEKKHEGTPGQEQLTLPIDDFLTRSQTPKIPRERRVFCNRNLKMSQIAWVGFDMDYTLAIYDQAEMDDLSIRATVEKLVLRGYPEFIRHITPPKDFPVRGLIIDKRYGHIVKMDRYKFVHKGYHGLRELTKDEIKDLYLHKKIRPATPRYHWIDTLYALSEVACYAALVTAMEDRGFAIDYAKTFTDIRECIDEAHRDGTILNAVAADLPRYIRRDPNLAPTLHKLRSSGKKLFLLTNSRWSYSDKMMTYLLGGAMGEYPSWRNFFDVVICAAQKPAFFQDNRPLLMREGEMLRHATFPLERGKIYEGGNLADFERALAVPGDEVLYVGDHIYGDILRSKKDSAWRTAMIIQELEQETTAHDLCFQDYERLDELESKRERTEDELRFYQSRVKELTRMIDSKHSGSESKHSAAGSAGAASAGTGSPSSPADLEAERIRIKRAIERLRGIVREVEAEVTAIDRRTNARFHPYFGPLLKEGSEQSSFGKQVEEYACVYTSRVSNFLSYSPQQYFRSPRDVMAHELG
jgi:HAD superfamily 5'-nucleotidase-like hydrolase